MYFRIRKIAGGVGGPKTKSTKEVEPTRPPCGGKYLEMTMATIDINLIYITLLFCVCVSSYAVLCKTEHQLPSTGNIC